MKITVLAVGKIKESFYREALSEYKKRLSRYCKLEIVEVADEKTDENASPVQIDQVKEKEAQRLLSHIRDTDYCIALASKAKNQTASPFPKRSKPLRLGCKQHRFCDRRFPRAS